MIFQDPAPIPFDVVKSLAKVVVEVVKTTLQVRS